MNTPSDLVVFVGRFHPLLVHLPIGFLVALAALELLARTPRFTPIRAGVGPVLALLAPAAAASAVCGWLLSRGGGYDAALLQYHQWTGFGLAAASGVLLVLHRARRARAYAVALAASLGLLVVASHFGGSLTHGSGYLVEHAPGPLRRLQGKTPSRPGPSTASGNDRQQPLFGVVVQPILRQYCVGCHGPEKAKADLRLDSEEGVRQGGKHGPVLASSPTNSLLLTLAALPPDHDDHMPPAGKPQPKPDDLALLAWWVESGASFTQTIAEADPGPDVRRLLDARLGPPRSPAGTQASTTPLPSPTGAPPAAASAAAPAAPRSTAEVMPVTEKLAADLGVALGAVSGEEPWLQCNASIAGTNFTDTALQTLAPLAANLVWLDLAGTAITDAGLAVVAGMPRLARLHLERTAVTDAGLAHLAGLNALEYLNLHHTAVTDAGLESLKALPGLRRLYLWQTRVTPDAARAFAESRADRAQIGRWQEEIAQLEAKIRQQQFTLELGIATNAAPAGPVAGAVAVNTACPVTGKPVDPAKTLVHEGKLVAFCCDDCKARFQADPKPFLEKLAQSKPAPR